MPRRAAGAIVGGPQGYGPDGVREPAAYEPDDHDELEEPSMLGLPDGVRAALFDLDGVLTQTADGAQRGVDRDVRRVPAPPGGADR